MSFQRGADRIESGDAIALGNTSMLSKVGRDPSRAAAPRVHDGEHIRRRPKSPARLANASIDRDVLPGDPVLRGDPSRLFFIGLAPLRCLFLPGLLGGLRGWRRGVRSGLSCRGGLRCGSCLWRGSRFRHARLGKPEFCQIPGMGGGANEGDRCEDRQSTHLKSPLSKPTRRPAKKPRKVTRSGPRAKSPGTAGSQNQRLFQGDHSLEYCDDEEWKIPAPETWEAIRKAATTAGTLISLKN